MGNAWPESLLNKYPPLNHEEKVVALFCRASADWVWALPHPGCVSLGKARNLSGSSCGKQNNPLLLLRGVWALVIRYRKHLAWHLAHSRHSVKGAYYSRSEKQTLSHDKIFGQDLWLSKSREVTHFVFVFFHHGALVQGLAHSGTQ